MSELTKEKIYKNELEKVGGEGNNNLERIRSLAGGGTTVVANPTLSGDEADLTGLQVGDTKYAVPQGGSGIEYISVSINGGTVTKEQLDKVFDTGNWTPLNAFFICDGQILQFAGTTDDSTELVFTSNLQYNPTYYQMVLNAKRLDYSIITVEIGTQPE